MNEVLLGNSYFMRFDPKILEAMQPYPPLGTLYAAAYLRQEGYAVALFDATLAGSEGEWETALGQESPRFAILYEDNFNYLSKMSLLRMRQAALAMINMAKRHGCTAIVCSADATDHPPLYLEGGADFVVLGEGEITLKELLDRLSGRSQAPLSSILGLAFSPAQIPEGEELAAAEHLTASGAIHTPRRPPIRQPDDLPFPAWDLADVELYRSLWLKRHGYFSMNMVTTRGCPFHCNWCAKPIWGQRYNVRSPENVAEEMKHLVRCYGAQHIWFADDILGLKPGWLPRFAEVVREEGLHVPFKCLERVDLLLRPGEVEALHDAGAQIVWVGAESGSQKILDAMDKGTRIEQIYEATRLLHASGVKVGFFLQFGYPGEERADIEKTVQMVRDCNPDDIGISVSYPLPGTRFYDSVQKQLGARQNWQDSSDLAMLYQGPFSTAFYRKLHSVVHKEFRARKAWQAINTQLSFRQLARFVENSFTLPIARWQLSRLASQTNTPLAVPHLAHEQAANPSPQEPA